jgi:DNA-directed RNA polymerase specialized sigma24 family protein
LDTQEKNSGSNPQSPATLGDVLYGNAGKRRVPEQEWVELLRSVAARSQTALQALYDRASRPVYALAVRITGDRESAEEATLDVFQDVWRRARTYEAADAMVLAWIMGFARARARERRSARRIDGNGQQLDGAGALAQPSPGLQRRLAMRIAEETRGAPIPPPNARWTEPEWEEVSPGLQCKILSSDTERDRVGMLVHLDPGVEYPPHTHAGVEELDLLQGELWIDDRKLVPGDYNRAEAPTGDDRVWTETGCSCVLITSTRDILR